MNYMQALAILGIIAAILVFVGCLAALAAIGSERIQRATDEVVTAERSAEWVRLNEELDRPVIDEKAYREAFDAWAKSVGLGN